MTKPFSQACENNKVPIAEQLVRIFASHKNILEIGSGTGQHAVHFSALLPHVVWQTSDQLHYHEGIHQWLEAFPRENLIAPIELTIGKDRLPDGNFDAVFSANTAHIMQKDEVKQLMELISDYLPVGGTFCQYGPFTLEGVFSSQSNKDFHHSLVERGYGGYRDLQELVAWAPRLRLVEQINMPANNMMLVWRKS